MWPNYRISLVGYHCSIEFPCGVPLFYCCKYPVRVHTHTHTCVNTFNRRPLIVLPLFGHNFFNDVLIGFVRKMKPGTPPQLGTIVHLLFKSPVWIRIQTHTHPPRHPLFQGHILPRLSMISCRNSSISSSSAKSKGISPSLLTAATLAPLSIRNLGKTKQK